MGFKLWTVPGPLLSQLGFWLHVLWVVQHGDPGCLWFTNCFTNISSLWEVWYTLHPPQLTRVTQCLSQTCLCLQLFRKFSQRGEKIPSLLFQCFIFKSTLSPSLFVLNQILLQGIALYSNGNCCISINRRRSCEWVQKNLDITFYWTFTFSSLFFENNIPCLVLSFFPTFVLRLTIMWNIEFGKHWMESF